MVLGATAVHGVFASILLRLIVGPYEIPGQALSVALSVLVTALAALAFLYVRTQYASPDHVARTLPWVWWTTPPIAALALAVVAVPVPDGPLGPALSEGKGARFHLAGRLEINEWNGRRSVQLRLEDAAPGGG